MRKVVIADRGRRGITLGLRSKLSGDPPLTGSRAGDTVVPSLVSRLPPSSARALREDPMGICAALYSGSKCYFFDGRKYIRVTRGDTGAGTVDPGYPKTSRSGDGPAGSRGSGSTQRCTLDRSAISSTADSTSGSPAATPVLARSTPDTQRTSRVGAGRADSVRTGSTQHCSRVRSAISSTVGNTSG
jgi:hypothetical protein